MIGYLFGVVFVVEVVVCIKVIISGEVYFNKNFEILDEGVDILMLVGITREKFDVKVVLFNFFGFGGYNLVVLFVLYKFKCL